jgi:hypothetical protein
MADPAKDMSMSDPKVTNDDEAVDINQNVTC